MANETRKEVNLVDQEYTEIQSVTVMQEQTVMEDQVVDGHVVQVPVIIEVPVIEEQEVTLTRKVYQEIEIELTDEEQAALNASRSAAIQASLIAALPAHRYDTETGGITIPVGETDLQIATDRYTQTVLIGARVLAKESSSYTVNWKTDDDTFVSLTASEIIAIANAVAAWVQKCFDTEKAISEKLNTYTTLEDMIADFNALMRA